MNDEKTKTDREQFLIWPSIVGLLFFLSCCWIYSNFADFIFFGGILFAIVIGISGLVKISGKQLREGASYLIPAISYFFILSPSLLDFRLQVIDVRHHVQFALNKQRYESEAREMEKTGIKLQGWKWGTNAGTVHSLVYDANDGAAHTDSTIISRDDPCFRHILKLGPHFYAVDDTCP
jgi:hypothetical protein